MDDDSFHSPYEVNSTRTSPPMLKWGETKYSLPNAGAMYQSVLDNSSSVPSG